MVSEMGNKIIVDIQTAVRKNDKEIIITAKIDDAEFTFVTDENPTTLDRAVELAVEVYKKSYVEEIMGEKEIEV